MAIIGGKSTEDEDKKNQPTTIGAPSGGSAPSGGAGAPAGGAPQQKGPSSSGQFTDVGKYVQANKPNISKMGQAVAAPIGQDIQSQSSDIAGQQAQQESSIKGSAISNQPYIGKKASDISDVQGARNVLQGGYSGPTGEQLALDGLAGLESSRAAAEQGQSLSGRQALLSESMNKDVQDYSAGERKLDSMFLGRDDKSRETFNQLGTQADDAIAQAKARQSTLQNLAGTTAAGNRAQGEALGQQLRDQVAQYSRGAKGGDALRKQASVDQLMNVIRDANTRSGRANPLSERMFGYTKDFNTARDELWRGGMSGADAEDAILRDVASRAYGDFAGSGTNALDGVDAQTLGQLNALQSLTQGTGYGDVASQAAGLAERGLYDQTKANQAISDWLNSGEQQDYGRGGGSRTLKT